MVTRVHSTCDACCHKLGLWLKVEGANEGVLGQNLAQKSSILRGSRGSNLRPIQLVCEFFNFRPFSAFVCNFDGDYLSSVGQKTYGCNLHIFNFLSVYYEPILAPEL